jgi:hypothetical protein
MMTGGNPILGRDFLRNFEQRMGMKTTTKLDHGKYCSRVAMLGLPIGGKSLVDFPAAMLDQRMVSVEKRRILERVSPEIPSGKLT